MKMLLILLIVTSSFCYMKDGSKNVDVDKEYNRKAFTGASSWIDIDKDCQDTRAEVLIEEAINDSVKSRDDKGCVIDSGVWHDLYTNKLIYAASDIDIDHVVSLKDAWESGADKWSKEKRLVFANYLDEKDHLMAVSKNQNRSKGAKSPDWWVPNNVSFTKEYCRRYIKIKLKWELTVTRSQLSFLQKILEDEIVVYPKVR